MNRNQLRAYDARQVYYSYQWPGMGDARPITQSVSSGLLSAAGIVSTVPGGQLPGAIIAAVGALTGLIGGMFKPDLTKIEASHIVDQIEAQSLKPMISSWRSLTPAQKTVSMQDTYLQIFDKAWAAVVQGCSNPALQAAGQACTTDRQQGACHWTLTGGTPGQPPNNCGNWFTWYRDPIANDPDVHADPAPESITDTVSSWFGGGTASSGGAAPSFPIPLLIGGALLVLALSMD